MEFIRKKYQKIIAWGLVAFGMVILLFSIFFHLNLTSYWTGVFLITVGVTLMLLAEGKK